MTISFVVLAAALWSSVVVLPPEAVQFDLSAYLRLLEEEALESWPGDYRTFRFIWVSAFDSIVHRYPMPGHGTTICVPDAPSYDQMVRIVVKHMQQHPETLHHERGWRAWPAPGRAGGRASAAAGERSAPWRVLSPDNLEIARQMAALHSEKGEEVLAIARESAKTGEPIVRSLEYQYPHEGYVDIDDQFFLGPDILVAPVLEKGARARPVVFPAGNWKGDDDTVVEGPATVDIDAPLERLPWYRRVEG